MKFRRHSCRRALLHGLNFRCHSREALLHGWLKSLKTCHTVA
ncbi:hypothetical protein [Rickettsia endosymbiont of Orchestes rusci]